MRFSSKKTPLLRHSGAFDQLESASHRKLSPTFPMRQIQPYRRVNTQTNSKSLEKKYILTSKKYQNSYLKLVNNHKLNQSKDKIVSKDKLNIADITSKFEENILPEKDFKTINAPLKKTTKTNYKFSKIMKNQKEKQNKSIQSSFNKGQLDSSVRKEQINNSFTSDSGDYEIFTDMLLGAGTFGKVFAGRSRINGQKVAIKCFQVDPKRKSRQIQLMETVKSRYVIRIIDKFTTLTRNTANLISIVMPQYESSFYQFLKTRGYQIATSMLKLYLYQILRGVADLHQKFICHRDLKPHNILFQKNRLVICDLGSAKILVPEQPNISYICSRCYRAPELIFGSTFYQLSIDMWSVGCIILEILNCGPLFVAQNSINHLIEIIKIMGTPTKKQVLNMNPQYDIQHFEEIPLVFKKHWHNVLNTSDKLLLDLIERIMVYSPQDRLKASQALSHPYFDELKTSSAFASLPEWMDI